MLLLLMGGAHAAQPNFAFYYADEVPWNELAAFDAVVVEPDHAGSPAQIPNGRTDVLAYVSVGEVQPSRPWFKNLPTAWRIGANTDWGSVIVDQAQADWPQWFVEHIARPLWDRGYRGFFLDTLDSYQLAAKTPAARAAQEAGLVRVVQALHRAFPQAKLVFNRGFEILPQLSDVVYAVAAESLFQSWDQRAGRYKEVSADDRQWLLGQLQRVKNEYGLPVISIDYVAPENRELARATAKKIAALGFIPWVSDAQLDMLGVGNIEVMPRKVLMLYDGSPNEYTLVREEIHRYGAMPINYLGYVPVYRALGAQALPQHPLIGRYAGVVTWFTRDNLGHAPELEKFLRRAIGEGVHIASLGNLGLSKTQLSSLFGLRASEAEPGAQRVEIVSQSPLMGFELKVLPDRRSFYPLQAAANAQVLLRLRNARGATMDAAAITPWGGYVLPEYGLTELPGKTYEPRWIIQPIEFLRRALALPPMPVPDVTTDNGRRLMMVHMDGDGFASRAEIHGTPFAAEVMLREIFEHYRVPSTVSVIEGEVAANGLYPQLSPALEAIARRMFALPNVEIASHSYSHPFSWRKAEGDVEGEGVALNLPGYEFNLSSEIEGSLAYINKRLAPPGKRARVFLWTGDCNPSGEAVARSEAAGVLNMNGGDTLMTRANPSFGLVAPLGAPKEGHFQIYAPNQNENVYTNNWTGPYYGYERAIETFQLTDAPYRLKPIDIYFHTYSASKPASLKALRKVFDWALAQPVQNIYASDYIRKVLDFRRMVVARDEGGYLVRGAGDVREMRVKADAGWPDLNASRAVVGFADHQGARYIHLSAGEAHIALGSRQPDAPYLRDANARLVDAQRSADGGWQLSFDGYLPIQLELANAARCTLKSNARVIAPRNINGAQRYDLNTHGRQTLTLSCGV